MTVRELYEDLKNSVEDGYGDHKLAFTIGRMGSTIYEPVLDDLFGGVTEHIYPLRKIGKLKEWD